ncbi:MAG: RNA polymerase sigma factor [Bacteroidales bacterium]|nr:RNA polymerase sigma factor [Bacteroidales bacterium]
MTGLDSELERVINGCLKNNRQSQKQLYEMFASRMFVVCRRYANSVAEAEDMLMEGFMNVFRNLSSYKGESRFDAWIYSVMVKSAISHYRSVRRFRNEVSLDDWEADELVNSGEAIYAGLDAAKVMTLMEQMSDTLRMAFNLREIEGYDFAEIAKMLGKKESAVRVAYMRAKKWLQNSLGSER